MDSVGMRKTFEELRPLLDEQGDLRRIVLNVGKAAALIAAMGRMVQRPEVRARFAELPGWSFGMRLVDNLERAGLALWYAAVQRKRAMVGATRSSIPAQVIAEAVELKQRMSMVAQYHLGADPAIAAELADIGAGKGYAELSSGLMRLMPIYEANEARLSRDPTHYRPDDRVRAGVLAHRILGYLGQGEVGQDRLWAGYVHRAYTFAVNTYEEVCAAGRWMFRHDGGESMFPSLFTTLRRTPASRASDEPAGDEPASDDVSDDAGDDASNEARAVAELDDSAEAVLPALAGITTDAAGGVALPFSIDERSAVRRPDT